MKGKAVKITVYGNVQGVFFRKFTQQVARSLEVNGFVRNTRDGSVYIEASGDEDSIAKLIAWCNKGPEKATIEKVEVSEIPYNDFKSFEIRRTE
jgi:acylphosphatase